MTLAGEPLSSEAAAATSTRPCPASKDVVVVAWVLRVSGTYGRDAPYWWTVFTSRFSIAAGVMNEPVSCFAMLCSTATYPAMCGAAIEVPEMVL